MLKFSTPKSFAYDAAGNLLSAGGLWSGDTVSYSYANRLRSGLSVGSWHQSYGYDAALRLTNLLSMAGSFGYAYDPVRLYRVDKLALPNSAYIAYHYDPLTRLLGTDLTRGTDNHVLDGYTYRYDLLGQRTGISRNNGFSSSTVSAGYDAIGELTSWSANEPDGAARFNEQLIYAYDAAGNLQQRWNHQFMQSFTVDAANELTNVTRSGILTVTGNTPTPASSVTINGQPAVTYGDFTFASSSGFALADGLNAFTNIAGNYSATVLVTNTLSVNLPASVNLQFDANGNLTNDGTRVFGYDAENQLTNVTVTGQWREDFLYDGLNRRRITRQYGWSDSAWALTNETRFVYDGKSVIQEWDSNNVAQVSYTRGSDRSGSRQGAGGIGGLLARTDATGSTYYHADGDGNITALMDDNQYIVARYLYDPFGRLLGKWGTLADANVYRFSSKEWDGNAGLYAYLYRFYDPNLQRWLNRDPIGERGGLNLYSYVANNPVNYVDPLGLRLVIDPQSPKSFQQQVVNDLNYLINHSPNGLNLVNQAINDPNTITITPGDEADTSGSVKWPESPNPNIHLSPKNKNGASDEQNKGMKKCGEGSPNDAEGGAVTLGHELGHALDDYDEPNDVDKTENPIRKDFGLPPRTTYHGVPIAPYLHN